METKKLLLIIGAMLSGICCWAQRENHLWVFGAGAGLDFSGGSPVAVESAINALEGAASVCDAQGNLLFYTNGDTIWNRNHQIMANGVLFPGLSTAMTFSTSQAVAIVPIPDKGGKLYYVFSLETNITTGGRLFYSVVDMNLDNGMGDVVLGKLGIHVGAPIVFAEKMIVLPGSNCDAWLVLKSFSDDSYVSFNISDTGMSTTPVISSVGLLQLEAYRIGVMKASPDGRRIAVAGAASIPFYFTGGIELCDFDPATGQLSNTVVLSATDLTYGVEFSPDGSKLYATQPNQVFQFNLDLPSTADIIASKTSVFSGITNFMVDLKRAPDDKVYFSSPGHTSMHKLDNPNVAGAGCNPVQDAIALWAGSSAQHGLPNVVIVPPSNDTIYRMILDTLVCTNTAGGSLIDLRVADGVQTWEWDDGSADTTRIVSSPGTYWLYRNDRCHPMVDSFHVRGGYISPLIIQAHGDTLYTSSGYDSWQWYQDGALIPGATQAYYVVNDNGVYTVEASMDNGCSAIDSFVVNNFSVKDKSVEALIQLYPNPAYTIVTLRLPDAIRNPSVQLVDVSGRAMITTFAMAQEMQVDISTLPPGVYMLSITTEQLVIRKKLIKG